MQLDVVAQVDSTYNIVIYNVAGFKKCKENIMCIDRYSNRSIYISEMLYYIYSMWKRKGISIVISGNSMQYIGLVYILPYSYN